MMIMKRMPLLMLIALLFVVGCSFTEQAFVLQESEIGSISFNRNNGPIRSGAFSFDSSMSYNCKDGLVNDWVKAYDLSFFERTVVFDEFAFNDACWTLKALGQPVNSVDSVIDNGNFQFKTDSVNAAYAFGTLVFIAKPLEGSLAINGLSFNSSIVKSWVDCVVEDKSLRTEVLTGCNYALTGKFKVSGDVLTVKSPGDIQIVRGLLADYNMKVVNNHNQALDGFVAIKYFKDGEFKGDVDYRAIRFNPGENGYAIPLLTRDVGVYSVEVIPALKFTHDSKDFVFINDKATVLEYEIKDDAPTGLR